MNNSKKHERVGGAARHDNRNGAKSRLQKPYSSESATSFRITITNPELSEPSLNDDSHLPLNLRPSIFSRLGDQASKKITGTYVVFENLPSSIASEDIKELCDTIGEVKSVYIVSKPGSLTKSAEIVFARRSHAIECVKKYHTVKLDGQPMCVNLKGEDGKVNPFNPFPTQTVSTNVREGFFGTAIQGDDTSQGSEQIVQYVDPYAGHSSLFSSSTRITSKGKKSKTVVKNRISKHQQYLNVDLDAELDGYMQK